MNNTAAFVVSLCLILPGCGFLAEDLPTSGTPASETTTTIAGTHSPPTPTPYPGLTGGVTAPTVASPLPGSELEQSQPVLVVSNATTEDQAPLTYSFEVGTDSGFEEIVILATGISQGTDGHTSWQVSETLESRKYFWRSRARSGMVKSPYSAVADFTVKAVATPPPPPPPPPPLPTPPAGVTVFDPLTGGSSVGEVQGGVFEAQGWRVTGKSDFIRYVISTLSSGYATWETRGLNPMNNRPEHYMLFGMWDPSRGEYRTNPFRVHIRKLDTRHNHPYIRLRWISGGEEHNTGYDFMNWNPQHAYQWSIEWGPESGSHMVRVSLDGQVIIEQRYSKSYRPHVHWVELGNSERHESIVGAIYANLQIGAR